MKYVRLLLPLFFVLAPSLFAQVTFDPGYFITDSGERIECLIRNTDRNRNPVKFSYKTEDEGETKIASIESVKEFGIYDARKFLRYSVNIDLSGDKWTNYSSIYEPEYEEKTVFLRVLVEGQISLLQYIGNAVTRYFLLTKKGEIEPLIYKKYFYDNSKLMTNKSYLIQLKKYTYESAFAVDEPEYKKRDLVNFFIEYNEVVGKDYKVYVPKREGLKISPTIGVQYHYVLFENYVTDVNVETATSYGIKIGAEIEQVLNFNRGKWSFVITPDIRIIKTETYFERYPVTVDLKSLNSGFGVKYKMFLSQNSMVTLRSGYLLGMFFNSEVVNRSNNNGLTMKVNSGMEVALGYSAPKFFVESTYTLSSKHIYQYLAFRPNVLA